MTSLTWSTGSVQNDIPGPSSGRPGCLDSLTKRHYTTGEGEGVRSPQAKPYPPDASRRQLDRYDAIGTPGDDYQATRQGKGGRG